MSSFDHILILGFGGPTHSNDVMPFIENVTRGKPIPKERLLEVAHHYELIGGASPYNELTFQLGKGIFLELRDRGVDLPIFYGMRNWHPYLLDTLKEIKRQGLRRGITMVLAPHRSEVSYDKYWNDLKSALMNPDFTGLSYETLPQWHDHPLFIDAQSDFVSSKIHEIGGAEFQLIFTTHSIPCRMAQESKYVEEFLITAGLIAKSLQITNWRYAYQSRSGSPRDPWLEPDILQVIEETKKSKKDAVLLVPIGFLCDNAEVLYDLDIEAKKAAESLELGYFRASTVTDHPSFVNMWAELIESQINTSKN